MAEGRETGTLRVKTGLAEMLKGGVIMDVVNAEQAKIAEEAGAVAVMALERVPADIRADGGVARMTDPTRSTADHGRRHASRSWPSAASATSSRRRCWSRSASTTSTSRKCSRPPTRQYHVDKHDFKVPFVCGCRDLGEALRRIAEGAAMIRTKGEAGHRQLVEAVRHMRASPTDRVGSRACARRSCSQRPRICGAPFELVAVGRTSTASFRS